VFGTAALLIIFPFFIIYPLFLYGSFRNRAVSVLVNEERIYVRQGLDAEVDYSLHYVELFKVTRNRFKKLYQLNMLEWFFPNTKEPVRVVMQKVDGTQILLFSYLVASPFKRNWFKFATKLRNETGKAVHLKDVAIS